MSPSVPLCDEGGFSPGYVHLIAIIA